MASRFVSGGAIDAGTGETVEPSAAGAGATSPPPTTTSGGGKRKEEWEAVQRELDAERKRREEQRRADAVGGEKSLYEILQANKAAKQAAFEEANKIKNQFRALDEDEVEFLDGVRESARAEEQRLRRETQEGIDLFRQEQARREREQHAATEGTGDGVEGDGGAEEGWTVAGGRKRKRREEKGAIIRGVKRRASSSGAGAEKETPAAGEKDQRESASGQGSVEVRESRKSSQPAAVAAKRKLGLVDYGSDDDDD